MIERASSDRRVGGSGPALLTVPAVVVSLGGALSPPCLRCSWHWCVDVCGCGGEFGGGRRGLWVPCVWRLPSLSAPGGNVCEWEHDVVRGEGQL